MTLSFQYPIRFAHCDPAGFAYFPKLMEILDGAVEDFMLAVTGKDRAQTHLRERLGIPTVDLQVGFKLPCRLGEMLDYRIMPVRIGTSSLTFDHIACVDGSDRFTARQTVVQIDFETGRPHPWSSETRALPVFAALGEQGE
jgi:4-hydroxybenzoyl-CoA thioesterase